MISLSLLNLVHGWPLTVALLMGVIFGAEPLTWKTAIGTLLTLAGIVVLTV